MIRKSAIKLFVGAIATAIAGTAMANTTLDATTTGDVFLNIEDTTNNSSYLFDTGVSQAAFNGNGSYSFNLSGDSALMNFLSTGDTFDYSVLSATISGHTASVFVTGNSNATPLINNNTASNGANADAAVKAFLSGADDVSTTSTNSVVLPAGSGMDWGEGTYEGVVSNKVYGVSLTPYADNAALNTPLAFYDVTGGTATEFASTWDFSTSGDILSYGPAAPVPLPTPVLLLLSGLGLMGAVARRTKLAA